MSQWSRKIGNRFFEADSGHGTIGILASHTDTTIQLNVATVPPSLVVELVDWRPNNISVSDASQF